jgi:Holliday junction resolvasome RuvABC endonuclease subunit
MSGPPATEKRVLAIDPTHRGFGYVVLEGPERLIDWGTRHVIGQKNKASLRAASELISLYRPHILVIEDVDAKGCWKRRRVRELLGALELLARERGLTVRRVPRNKVKRVFLARGITNKHQMARFIAARFPELARCVPPERKAWMSEDLRTAVFDAAAMAWTFLTRISIFQVDFQLDKTPEKS